MGQTWSVHLFVVCQTCSVFPDSLEKTWKKHCNEKGGSNESYSGDHHTNPDWSWYITDKSLKVLTLRTA